MKGKHEEKRMERAGENIESCRESKSDERTMKFDRRMNMTTLQSPSMKRPEASVKLVILCPSAQCSNPYQQEGCQFRKRGGGHSRCMSR